MRIVLAALALASFTTVASAGLKCEKLPRIVFYSTEADVHDDGTWHRTKDKVEKQGYLDGDALGKFRAFAAVEGRFNGAKDKPAQDVKVIACLDALIAKPTGAAATKACTVPKRS